MQSLNDMDQHLQTMQVALVNLAAINALQPFEAEKEHYNRYQEQNITSFNEAFSQLSNRDIVRLLMNRESLNPLNTKPHPLWALNSTQESLVQFKLDPNSDNKLKRKNQNETAAASIGHCQMTINGMPNGATVYAKSRISTDSKLHTDYAEHIRHESGTLHGSVVFRNFMRLLLTEESTQSIVRARMKQFQSSEKNAAMLIAIPCVLGGLTALAPLFVNLSTTPTLLAGLIAHAPLALLLDVLLMAVCGLLYLNAFFDNMLDIQNIPDTGAEEGIYLGQYNTLIQEGLTLFMASCSSIQRSIIGFFTESDTPESNQVAPEESTLRPAAAGVAAPAIRTRAAQKQPSQDQSKRLEKTESVLRKLDDAIQSGDASTLSKKEVTRLNSAYQNEFGRLVQDHQHLALNSKSIRSIYVDHSGPHTLETLKAFVQENHQSQTATLNR